MAMTLVHDGPTMDWTMDNKIYDRYLIWKSDVELIFSSALLGASPLQKSSYLKLWMGKEAKPLIQKWICTKKLDLSTEEEAAKKKPSCLQSFEWIHHSNILGSSRRRIKTKG